MAKKIARAPTKRAVRVGGRQSGKTAQMKKAVSKAKKQGKKVVVLETKKAGKPYTNQFNRSRTITVERRIHPYTNQYGSKG